MKKNLFIAFEGIDGSGKSTQVKLLAEYLTSIGHKVYTTFEPTDSPIGKMIRDIFNHRMEGDQLVIAALFAADRLNHLLHSKDGILSKLQEGYTVLTDRYYLSSYAYHSVYVDMDWVIQANAQSAALLKPDINIYIDISPEVSMDRLNKNRVNLEMYETLDHQKAVYQMYEKSMNRVEKEETIVRIKGDNAPEKIAKEVRTVVSKLLLT